MALFLTRFSYTPETWARLMKNPEDRREAARLFADPQPPVMPAPDAKFFRAPARTGAST